MQIEYFNLHVFDLAIH